MGKEDNDELKQSKVRGASSRKAGVQKFLEGYGNYAGDLKNQPSVRLVNKSEVSSLMPAVVLDVWTFEKMQETQKGSNKK